MERRSFRVAGALLTGLVSGLLSAHLVLSRTKRVVSPTALTERTAQDAADAVPTNPEMAGPAEVTPTAAGSSEPELLARRASHLVVNLSLLISLLLIIDLVGRTGGPAVPEPVDLQISSAEESGTEDVELRIPIIVDLVQDDVAIGEVSGPIGLGSLDVAVSASLRKCETNLSFFAESGSPCLDSAVTTSERAGQTIVRLPALRGEVGAPDIRGHVTVVVPDGMRVESSSIPLVHNQYESGEWDPSDGAPLIQLESRELVSRSAQIATVEAILIGFALNFVAAGIGDIIRGRRTSRRGVVLKAGWVSTLVLLAASLLPDAVNLLLANRSTYLSPPGQLAIGLVAPVALLVLLILRRVSVSSRFLDRTRFVTIERPGRLVAMVGAYAVLILILYAVVVVVSDAPIGPVETLLLATGGVSFAVALLAAIMTQDWLSRYFSTGWATLYAIIASAGLSAWYGFSLDATAPPGSSEWYGWATAATLAIPTMLAVVLYTRRANASIGIMVGLTAGLLTGGGFLAL